MVSYFKNQRDLANALIVLIDNYWNHELDEEILIKLVNEISKKNHDKLFKNGNYTSMVNQRLGKRRVELLNKLIEYNRR